MTASVVSACLYGIMCFALPTPSGKPLLQAPSPQGLMLVPDEPGCSQKSVPSACLAKTLILGQTESDLAESDGCVLQMVLRLTMSQSHRHSRATERIR